MRAITGVRQAWTEGYKAGCIQAVGQYTGIPHPPVLKVPTTEDPVNYYYKDGKRQGIKDSLDKLKGNTP